MSSELISALISRVSKQGLSYLDKAALAELGETVIAIEEQQIPGIVLEAGCALGGSGIVIAASKALSRDFYIYDVFGMIPPPSRHDGADVFERYALIKSGKSSGINGEMYYGYENDLYEKVRKNFKDFGFDPAQQNIHFTKGLYEHSLHVHSSVAFAHIDCDWYESVTTCLQRIEPWLATNVILVIDDYDTWSGCRTAVDEYFSDKKKHFSFERKSRLHIKKISAEPKHENHHF